MASNTSGLATAFDLKAYLLRRRSIVNRRLQDLLTAEPSDRTDDGAQRVAQAMRYCLLSGGKRLRPLLCMAAAEAVGGRAEDVLPAACALELIHTYSLVHDDLPAMDDDTLRRGRATCHVAFDEATAVLAGDGLLTLAFAVLAEAGDLSGIPAKQWLRTAALIARAAGYEGMIGGQMTDVFTEGRAISVAALQRMHLMKTGALIAAAIHSGAFLGGGSGPQIESLGSYAENIGLAFQITDDILNVEGDPALLGKSVGTDASRGKTTYPSLLGLDRSKELARQAVSDALQAVAHFDTKADPLRAIAGYIIERQR